MTHFDTALNLFIKVVEEHRYFGYGFLFLGMIIEGEIILMTAGILVNINALGLGETFLVAYLGVLANDAIWYYLGARIRNKYGENAYIKKAERKVNGFMPNIREKPAGAIFISKFIMGLNHPTLVLLGYFRVRFAYFMKIQAFASFAWTSVFLTLGTIFGYTAINLTGRFQKFIFVAIFFIVAVIILERIIRYFFKKKKLFKIF